MLDIDHPVVDGDGTSFLIHSSSGIFSLNLSRSKDFQSKKERAKVMYTFYNHVLSYAEKLSM